MKSVFLILSWALCLAGYRLAAQPQSGMDAEALLQQAAQHMDYGRYAEALALAREVVQALAPVWGENSPRLAEAYCAAGLAAIHADKPAAEGYLRQVRAIELAPDSPAWPTVYYFQGMRASREGEHDEAMQHFVNALDRFRQTGGAPVLEGSIYAGMGYTLLSQKRYAGSIAQNEVAVNIWEKAYGPDYPRLAHAYNNIGQAYFQGLGQPRQALTYHQRARALREKTLGPDHPDLVASLNNIGLVCNAIGDFDYATEYLYKALDIARRTGLQTHLTYIYTNLGVASSGKKEHALARQYYEKVLEIEEALYGRPDHPEILITVFNLAVSYKDEGNFEAATRYYQRALDMAEPNHPYRVMFYNGMGLAQLSAGQHAAAEANFRTALKVGIDTYGPSHPYVVNAYYGLGSVAMAQEQPATALNWNQQALTALGYRGGDNRDGVLSDLYLVNTLSQRCRFLWQQAQAAPQNELEDVLKTCGSLIRIFDQISRTYRRASSRQQLMELTYPIFEIAIAAHLRRYRQTNDEQDFAAALAYAERSKGLLLYEALVEAEAQQLANIPPQLLRQEAELRDSLAHYETRRQGALAKGAAEDDPAVLDVAYKIRQIDDAYDRLLDVFEQDYPRYFQAKHTTSAPDLATIQQTLLSPGQSLVEYVVGEKDVYIFLVQPTAYEAIVLPKEELDAWVAQMVQEGLSGFDPGRRGSSGFQQETASGDGFTTAAQKLYDKLWRPIRSKLGASVIVIPDGVLGYLPFEALVSGEPPRRGIFWAYPFLINDHCISYAYSAALLQEMRKQPPTRPAAELLVFAPFHQSAEKTEQSESYAEPGLSGQPDTLAGLPSSAREAADIGPIWNGKVYYGAEASVAAFRQEAPQYRFLHIATHGKADDRLGDYAYLAFGIPEQERRYARFYAREIYTLSLNAELVFLSACETGIGRLRRGEGVISLARAFSYAGARSIVSSLWPVKDDDSIPDISRSFYQYLKGGMGKAEALRQAKLDYFEAHKGGGQKSHPYYWAGLIGSGDMQ